jgi:hypothetical protein
LRNLRNPVSQPVLEAAGVSNKKETGFVKQYLRQEGRVDTQGAQPLQAIGFINRLHKTLSGFSGRDFSTAASKVLHASIHPTGWTFGEAIVKETRFLKGW